MHLKAISKALVSFVLILTMLMSSALAYEELAKGSKGDAVVALQERLNELGYSVGTADGDFGNKTKDAVARFQTCNGISITGIADEDTQIVLFGYDAIEHRFGTSKKDIIDEISNRCGKAITDITRTDNGNDSISFVVDNRSGILFVCIGSQCYFWTTDITYDNFSFIKSLLYQYSGIFDSYEYVNKHTAAIIGYKDVESKSTWNGSSFTHEPYQDDEIIDFLMLIDSEVVIEQDIVEVNDENANVAPTTAPTPKPTAAPTKKPESSQTDIAACAVKKLKNQLLNPTSLQVHKITIYSGKEDSYYYVVIDASAMNRAGGYNREDYHVRVNQKATSASVMNDQDVFGFKAFPSKYKRVGTPNVNDVMALVP